ncbi:MAG TPA: DUF502 domain-containing protein [Chitinispirillaceae bacterium]|nr:DUF502 domain-containing protein [Chitinispirillaceae bacterium]
MKSFRSYFLAGAFALIPIILSLYLIYNFIVWIDNVFPSLTGIDLPFGVGFICTISITVVTGMVAKNYIGKKIIKLGNAIIVSVPVLNKVFLTLQQIMDVLVNKKKNMFGQVVLAPFPKEGSWCLGFITCRDVPSISKSAGTDVVSVYVPTTPNPTSGFLMYTSESNLIPLDITPEMAVKSIVSAGMVSSGSEDSISNSDVNLADVLKKWKISKSAIKNGPIDPRD